MAATAGGGRTRAGDAAATGALGGTSGASPGADRRARASPGGGTAPSHHLPSLAELGKSGVAHERVKKAEEELKGLLADQARLARELAAMVEKLSADTHATSKNLEAAIAQARNPGYWRYHVPPAEVSKIEAQKKVDAHIKAIAKVQADIDRVRSDMERAAERPTDGREPRKPESLRDWFREHGRPTPGYGGAGYASELEPPTRVYGGTKHYPGFRSVARRLKPGRALK
jgi:hypothetical protein